MRSILIFLIYCFCDKLIAQNNVGSPIIISSFVSQVLDTSITLNAIVNPNGGKTTVLFKLGNQSIIEASYIERDSSSFLICKVELSNLKEGVRDSFGIIADNDFGSSFSSWTHYNTLLKSKIVWYYQYPKILAIFPTNLLDTSVNLNGIVQTVKGSNQCIYYLLNKNGEEIPLYSQNLEYSPVPTRLRPFLLNGIKPDTTYLVAIRVRSLTGNFIGTESLRLSTNKINTNIAEDYEVLLDEYTNPNIVEFKIDSTIDDYFITKIKINPRGTKTFVSILSKDSTIENIYCGFGSHDTIIIIPVKYSDISSGLKAYATNPFGVTLSDWVYYKQPIIYDDTKDTNTQNDSINKKININEEYHTNILPEDSIVRIINQFSSEYFEYKSNLKSIIKRSKRKDYYNYKYLSITDFIKLDEYFSQLPEFLPQMDDISLLSAFYLCKDYNYGLNLIKSNKRHLLDSITQHKINNLIINTFEFCSYYFSPSTGLNYNEENSQVCSNQTEFIFTNSLMKYDLTYYENECTLGDGYPIKVAAYVKDKFGNVKQLNYLTVNFRLSILKEYPPFKFEKLTSPSCKYLKTGIWQIWLTDEFNKNILLKSQINEFDLRRKKDQYPESYIKEIDIPVN